MSISDDFNKSYSAKLQNPQVLKLTYGYQEFYYDFLQRQQTTLFTYGSSFGGVATTPFSQVDRETLVEMRDKLVELGGTPKELPAEPVTVPKPRGLNP